MTFISLKRAIEIKKELQDQYAMAENSRLTAEERVQRMANALKKEESHIVDVERELTKLRAVQVSE